MKRKRPQWKLMLLCVLPVIPLLALTSARDGAYRLAAYTFPPLREAWSHELSIEVMLGDDWQKIRRLISHGADVNYLGTGQTPLDSALRRNHVPLALLLIQNGADPNHRATTDKPTMFYKAATQTNSPALVREMLKNGANVKDTDGTSDNSLLCTVLIQRRNEIARLLIENGVDVNERSKAKMDYTDRTPLICATENGSKEIVNLLLQRGAQVNNIVTRPTERKRTTALAYAVRRSNPKIVEMLLAHGANPNLFPTQRYDDLTDAPLVQALAQTYGSPVRMTRDQEKIVWMLLKHNADVKVSNAYFSPLLCASSRFAPRIVREIVRRGANVNWQNQDKGTALMNAAVVGDAQTVQLLLQHGAEKTLRDNDGKTALDYARREKHFDVVGVLEVP